MFLAFKIVMKGGRFASRLTTLQHNTSRRYKQKQNIIKQRSSKSNKGTRNAYQTQLQTRVTQRRGCGSARGRRLWGRKVELEIRLTEGRSCGGAHDLNEAVTEENKTRDGGEGREGYGGAVGLNATEKFRWAALHTSKQTVESSLLVVVVPLALASVLCGEQSLSGDRGYVWGKRS